MNVILVEERENESVWDYDPKRWGWCYVVEYHPSWDQTTLQDHWIGDQFGTPEIARLDGKWSHDDVLRLHGLTPIRVTPPAEAPPVRLT